MSNRYIKNYLRIILLLVFTILMISGCGGSDDPAPPATGGDHVLKGRWENTVTLNVDGEENVESSVTTIDSQGRIIGNSVPNAEFSPYSGQFGSVSSNGEITGTFTFSMTDSGGDKSDHKQIITGKLIFFR